jgi:hypothetical protein
MPGSLKRIASVKRGIKIKANLLFGNSVRLSRSQKESVTPNRLTIGKDDEE